MDNERRFLNPPKVKFVTYKRNFIKTAVCELRFPTLLELEAKPPHSFQASIRKQYPFYEAQVLEQVGAPEPVLHEQSYLFRSKDRKWTVNVKSSSIGIETSNYSDFTEFFERFSYILDRAKEMIDTDFFTRVGLRYINAIPVEDSAEGWIKGDLLLPLTGGILGDTKSCMSAVHGYMEKGQYSFRHGLKRKSESELEGKVETPSYSLDFDYFSENVEFGEVHDLIKYFHEMNFAFFSWCLDEKAINYLGEGKEK